MSESAEDLDYLTVDIFYNVKTDKYKIEGTVKSEKVPDILEAFLTTQMGKGEDTNKPKRQENYHITIEWYPIDDRFVVKSDTGNKSLRDGILLYLFQNYKQIIKK
ncbi:MAG: hypothetical protein WC413_03775 [Candidatus Nanoarchaeia archaeon]